MIFGGKICGTVLAKRLIWYKNICGIGDFSWWHKMSSWVLSPLYGDSFKLWSFYNRSVFTKPFKRPSVLVASLLKVVYHNLRLLQTFSISCPTFSESAIQICMYIYIWTYIYWFDDINSYFSIPSSDPLIDHLTLSLLKFISSFLTYRVKSVLFVLIWVQSHQLISRHLSKATSLKLLCLALQPYWGGTHKPIPLTKELLLGDSS